MLHTIPCIVKSILILIALQCGTFIKDIYIYIQVLQRGLRKVNKVLIRLGIKAPKKKKTDKDDTAEEETFPDVSFYDQMKEMEKQQEPGNVIASKSISRKFKTEKPRSSYESKLYISP